VTNGNVDFNSCNIYGNTADYVSASPHGPTICGRFLTVDRSPLACTGLCTLAAFGKSTDPMDSVESSFSQHRPVTVRG
jgi:hypothetical protein